MLLREQKHLPAIFEGTIDFLNIFTPCLLMKTVNILSDYAGNESSLFHFCMGMGWL